MKTILFITVIICGLAFTLIYSDIVISVLKFVELTRGKIYIRTKNHKDKIIYNMNKFMTEIGKSKYSDAFSVRMAADDLKPICPECKYDARRSYKNAENPLLHKMSNPVYRTEVKSVKTVAAVVHYESFACKCPKCGEEYEVVFNFHYKN